MIKYIMKKSFNNNLKMLLYNKQNENQQLFNSLQSNESEHYIRFMANAKPKITSSLLSNTDINMFYNPTGFTGSRNTIKNPVIVIVNAYTTPNILKDFATYCNTFNIPLMNGLPGVSNNPKLANFTIHYQKTNTTSQFNATYGPTNTNSFIKNNNGWGLEINLDIQYAHTIAPYADIVLILAKTASVADLTAAVKFGNTIRNAVSLSMSWGANENKTFTQLDSMFNNVSNIIHTAASGDSGSAGGIIWPSSNPNVISVGGTQITKSGNTFSETAWSGSGGGISSIYNKPTYQRNINLGTKRLNPDISMLAAPSITVCDSFYSSDGWVYNIGGTSLASPMIAALVALAIQYKYPNGLWNNITKSKFIQSIYNNPNYNNVIRDITIGNNGGYQTKINYDFVTGVGSPKITNSNMINSFLYALTN